MAEIHIDKEKLVYGFRRGIEHSSAYEIKDLLPPHLPCGFVSSVIHEYALQKGIPSELYLSEPKWDFDPDKRHVFSVLGEGDDRLVVDASYSQFLSYVGLAVRSRKRAENEWLSNEEILNCRLSRIDYAVDMLTNMAVTFRSSNNNLPDYLEAVGSGNHPLKYKTREEIRQAYSQIWNPANTTIWTPPEYAAQDGKIVSSYIPEGAITEA